MAEWYAIDVNEDFVTPEHSRVVFSDCDTNSVDQLDWFSTKNACMLGVLCFLLFVLMCSVLCAVWR